MAFRLFKSFNKISQERRFTILCIYSKILDLEFVESELSMNKLPARNINAVNAVNAVILVTLQEAQNSVFVYRSNYSTFKKKKSLPIRIPQKLMHLSVSFDV